MSLLLNFTIANDQCLQVFIDLPSRPIQGKSLKQKLHGAKKKANKTKKDFLKIN